MVKTSHSISSWGLSEGWEHQGYGTASCNEMLLLTHQFCALYDGTLSEKEGSFLPACLAKTSQMPRGVVGAPSREAFKARLDRALGNLVELWCPVHCRGVAVEELGKHKRRNVSLEELQ